MMLRTGPKFEEVLARIYVDTGFREEFLKDPVDVARRAGLTAEEAEALAAIDRQGLDLAARSFAVKRMGH